jgi:molecular chaperone HscA
MLREGFAQADTDAAARSLREARVDADRLVLATRSAIAADGDLLADGERAAIEAEIAATQHLAQSEDHHAITTAIKALAESTEAFAAARMNRGIRQALAGRSIDEI